MRFIARLADALWLVQYAGNVDAMAKWLRVTSLGYLAPEGLVEAATRSSGDATRFRHNERPMHV